VARPAQQATVVVLAHGGDAEALVQLLGLNVVAGCLRHCDPTHGAAAPVMKDAQLGEEVLAQEPHLAAVEEDREHESRVHLAPKGLYEGEVAQHTAQGTKGRRWSKWYL
jgi:hypothetical protein